jgi:formylglycine-generating enzyme required for sulfatase activity
MNEMMVKQRRSRFRHLAASPTAAVLAVIGSLLTGCNDRGAGHTGVETKVVDFTTDSGVEMVFLSGGQFAMGSEQGEADEQPKHVVSISPFAIDRFEVTHAQFTKAQLPNPSKWQDDPRGPVNQLRWREAKIYCNERSIAEGLESCYDELTSGLPCDFSKNGYRLPTEAEWEYAARCGASGEYPFGAENKLSGFAWHGGNSNGRAHVVGSRKPNAWGIHDLYGNLSEWCQDVYHADFYQRSPKSDPTGPERTAVDVKRVVRGGSWKSTANMCRVSFRQGQTTGDSDACFSSDDCGFRCVRRLSQEQAERLTKTTGPQAGAN